MTDLTKTIIAKSDQLNSDDLMGGPRTITITNVSADESSPEQPIVINFEGDNRKPWKPCKTMRRLMVSVWGPNGKEFIGKSMTIYRDPSVKYGGLEVGGIRVSHMSHIEKPITIALTATRGNKKPVTVQPLRVEQPKQQKTAPNPHDEYAREFGRRLKNDPWQAVDSWWTDTEKDREGMDASRVENMNAALADKIEKESVDG